MHTGDKSPAYRQQSLRDEGRPKPSTFGRPNVQALLRSSRLRSSRLRSSRLRSSPPRLSPPSVEAEPDRLGAHSLEAANRPADSVVSRQSPSVLRRTALRA